MYAESSVLFEVGVGEQCGPLAVGELLFKQVYVVLRCDFFASYGVKEEQMVVHVRHVRIVGILRFEPVERLETQCQVVELVFEDDAGVVETVHDGGVALCHLLFCKRNLCEIVFAAVRVVLCAVGLLRQRVGCCFGCRDRVGLLL